MELQLDNFPITCLLYACSKQVYDDQHGKLMGSGLGGL